MTNDIYFTETYCRVELENCDIKIVLVIVIMPSKSQTGPHLLGSPCAPPVTAGVIKLVKATGPISDLTCAPIILHWP